MEKIEIQQPIKRFNCKSLASQMGKVQNQNKHAKKGEQKLPSDFIPIQLLFDKGAYICL